MEYSITTSEIPAQCAQSEDYDYSGLLIHIRPPVQLSPEAVHRYLTAGDFEPFTLQDEVGCDVKDVTLLGSTPEQTTIYASVKNDMEGYASGVTQEITRDTVRLLQFMGAKAIVEQGPTDMSHQ